MRQNRYRNVISLPVLTTVLIVCGAGLLAALSVVMNKNRIASMAEQQRQVEQEIKMLRFEMVTLERKVSLLLDSARVQPLLQAKGTWLQKISPDAHAIIHLKKLTPPTGEVAQTSEAKLP